MVTKCLIFVVVFLLLLFFFFFDFLMCMFVRTNTIKNAINIYSTFIVYLAISKKPKKANYSILMK